MVRASAKNFKDVVIVTYPSRYAGLMEMLAKEGDVMHAPVRSLHWKPSLILLNTMQ